MKTSGFGIAILTAAFLGGAAGSLLYGWLTGAHTAEAGRDFRMPDAPLTTATVGPGGFTFVGPGGKTVARLTSDPAAGTRFELLGGLSTRAVMTASANEAAVAVEGGGTALAALRADAHAGRTATGSLYLRDGFVSANGRTPGGTGYQFYFPDRQALAALDRPGPGRITPPSPRPAPAEPARPVRPGWR